MMVDILFQIFTIIFSISPKNMRQLLIILQQQSHLKLKQNII